MLADAPGVGADLVSLGVSLGRHVAGFLEQRHVDVRFDVARRTGVAVPVPRPAEVAADLDNANTLDTRLAQPRCSQQTAEAAADDQDVNRVIDRGTRPDIAVRIGVKLLKARDVEVCPAGLGRRPAVAFPRIARAQRFDVDHGTVRYGHSSAPPRRRCRDVRSAV